MRILTLIAVLISITAPAHAFCGFFVAKADGELFNQSSRVAYVRDGRRSTITMGADYRGPVSEFAMVIPTPRVLKEKDIRTVDGKILKHLDDYSAPRLVEYHDRDPCGPAPVLLEPVVVVEDSASGIFARRQAKVAKSLGVKIKGRYAVDAYDVLILDAKQSDGLQTFLTGEGYTLPKGAGPVLADYINKGMKFFVAKVNLDRHSKSKAQELKPLQISFKSKDFMLPLQLGKLNAEDAQDALFFMITREGRVEMANYPNNKIPADVDVPIFVEDMFPKFYRAVFDKAASKRAPVVMEYAWDMAWCDPCAADPLSNEDLATLGVTWLREGTGQAKDVYLTRFHAQYTKDQMRKDPKFKITKNRKNFQGRYVMNHPFEGDISCEAGQVYLREKRHELRKEAVTLAEMTGWTTRGIEDHIKRSLPPGFW